MGCETQESDFFLKQEAFEKQSAGCGRTYVLTRGRQPEKNPIAESLVTERKRQQHE